MISFRYHIVSIVAVFVALALGIVVGTTALNGPITTDLRKQVNGLKQDRSTLAQQVKGLQGQVNDAGSFASTYGATLVAKTLTKQKVIIVGMPGANTTVEDQAATLLRSAGASVTGRINLSSDYVNQSRAGDIDSLVLSQQQGINVTLPTTNDAGKLAATMLSYVLLGKGQSTDITQVLAGFQNLGVLTAPSTPIPATNVVIVGTDSVPTDSYEAGVELDLVEALQAGGAHAVVVGDAGSAKDAGIVAQVRDGGLKSVVSTVDNADTSIGLVSTVLALNAARSGNFGHYGTGAGATHLFPPSPSR